MSRRRLMEGKTAPPPAPEPPVLLSGEHVLWSIANNRYATDYSIGDLIPLDLGTEGVINMQIVAIDADEKADGSGKAPLTFIGKELLVTSHRMNPKLAGTTGAGTVGTGTIGGGEQCEMRSWLKGTIKPKIPTYVRNSIVDVTKYTYIYNADETTVQNSATTDDVWIPSEREIFGGTGQESNGEYYSGVFQKATMRKKMKVNDSSTAPWWLRSAKIAANFRSVNGSGAISYGIAYYEYGVALGFCL